MQGVIRRALKEDMDRLAEFLLKAGLEAEGLSEELAESFLLLEDGGGSLIGTLGMEEIAESGLLRSLVVTTGQAEQDILLLFEQMLVLAREKGMKNLYLATNKSRAVPFFELLGFRLVPREALPGLFYESSHIRQILQVDNSLFLKYRL